MTFRNAVMFVRGLMWSKPADVSDMSAWQAGRIALFYLVLILMFCVTFYAGLQTERLSWHGVRL